MNRRYLALIISMTLVLGMALLGCSSSGSSEPQSTGDESLVGTWQLTSRGDASDQSSRDESGYAEFLILKEDGSATYEYLGEYYDGTFDEKSNPPKVEVKRKRVSGDIEIENGVLKTQSGPGEDLEFKKIDDAEREAYDAKFNYAPYSIGGDENGEPIVNELETVLVDDEYCTITATSSYELNSLTGYDLEVANKTDERLLIRSVGDSFSVGGEKAESAVTIEVPPNETESGTVAFYISSLGGGLDKLKDVKFQLEASTPSNSSLATYDIAL